MSLGDLEFKAEDFVDKNNPNRKLLSEDDIALADAMAEFSAEQANRLLRERAPKMWNKCVEECAKLIEQARCREWSPKECAAQIRQRLVCIEELAGSVKKTEGMK